MSDKDDNQAADNRDVGGFEVPAAGTDPDSRMRLMKQARAVAEQTGDDPSEWEEEIQDERNRAGRGPQQDEEARQELERAEVQRREAAERRRNAADESTSDGQETRAKTEAPKGRTATPARSTTDKTPAK